MSDQIWSVAFKDPPVSVECRQTVELPEIKPEVTQYTTRVDAAAVEKVLDQKYLKKQKEGLAPA